MNVDKKTANLIAQQYLGTPLPPDPYAWGISGYVYLSPDLQSVVKVHHRKEGYDTELEVYQRLRRLGLTRLHGLEIPKLRDYRDDLKVIRLDFVNKPFLVDFAGVLFQPPETLFSAETIEQWHAEIQERFGRNAHIAYAVYHSLAQHGMYYVDMRPSNVNVQGLPGVEPFEAMNSDDL